MGIIPLTTGERMSQKEHIEELLAQVETHGADSVKFVLENADENGENLDLDIENVQYNGAHVVVLLS